MEYLVEFGQWLYVNDFPLQDAMDQVEWAADILLNMTAQASQSAAPVETKGTDPNCDILFYCTDLYTVFYNILKKLIIQPFHAFTFFGHPI